jgi:hypothetical protein
MEEFAESTPFEPTIAPSKVFQCGLPTQIKSSCQLESINSSSSSCMNVIHGQMRRPEKSSKSAVDDNCISEDDFDLNYSGDQAEDDKNYLRHEEESKSPTSATAVGDSAETKVEYESNNNGNNRWTARKGRCYNPIKPNRLMPAFHYSSTGKRNEFLTYESDALKRDHLSQFSFPLQVRHNPPKTSSNLLVIA